MDQRLFASLRAWCRGIVICVVELASTTRSVPQKQLRRKGQELNLATLVNQHCAHMLRKHAQIKWWTWKYCQVCDPVMATGPKECDMGIPSDLVRHATCICKPLWTLITCDPHIVSSSLASSGTSIGGTIYRAHVRAVQGPCKGYLREYNPQKIVFNLVQYPPSSGPEIPSDHHIVPVVGNALWSS